MKKLFTIMAAVLLTATVWAQSPQKMSYQAVIRNGSALVTGTSVPMVINIWKDAVGGGTKVYTETQTPSTNSNGVVSIEIGGGDPVAFAAISWSGGAYFIETSTDLTAAGGTTVTGSSQLLSVPYALYAGHYVGERFGGGIVVSVWKIAGVEHGLIASLVELTPTYVAWSDVTNVLIGSTAQSQINGQTNTTAIVAQSTATSAADLCDAYTNTETGTGVFSDWYLPAVWELNECFRASYIVSVILLADAFKFDYYWSSTESAATTAYYVGFHTNIFAANGPKNSATGYVRAVRRF